MSGDDDGAVCCCSVCGGINVEYAVWYDPNADVTGDVFGTFNSGDNTFCSDCDDNHDLVDKGAEPERFAKLRRKHRAKEKREAEAAEKAARKGARP